MLHAVAAHVSATATAAAIKVSSSFLTAHSPLVRRHKQRWLRVMVVHHVSAEPDDDSGHAHPRRAGLDVHQRQLSSVDRSVKSDSFRLHHHAATAVSRIEHGRCSAKGFNLITMQPATDHIVLVLVTTPGATETAWRSDTRPYGHRAHEMWALCRPPPLVT